MAGQDERRQAERARRLVVLVGQPRAIAMAVNNNAVAARYTGLTARLLT
jgi:ATP-dependent exoDNAse (exonuclease V) alpha subunit